MLENKIIVLRDLVIIIIIVAILENILHSFGAVLKGMSARIRLTGSKFVLSHSGYVIQNKDKLLTLSELCLPDWKMEWKSSYITGLL